MSHSRTLPAWAVMCGAIRRLVEFQFSLGELAKLREKGLLDEIVLSTWCGEIDAHDGLRQSLIDVGVILVECDPPADIGSWAIYGQHKVFLEGLDVCPADAFIFKHRTDRAFGGTWAFETHLRQDLPMADGPGRVFRHKVVCTYYSTTVPVLLADILFLGHADDVRRMLNFDRGYDAGFYPNAAMILPDMRWMTHPFARRSRLINWWLRNVPLFEMSRAIMNYAADGAREPLPTVVRDVLALNLAYLHANFLTMHLMNEPDVGDPINLFREPEPGFPQTTPRGAGWTLLMNTLFLSDFVEGRSASAFPHIAELGKIAAGDVGDIERRSVSADEAAAAAAFRQAWYPEGPPVTTGPTVTHRCVDAEGLTHHHALTRLEIWKALDVTPEDFWSFRADLEGIAANSGVPDALYLQGVACLDQGRESLGQRLLAAALGLQSIPAGILLVERLLQNRPEGWRTDARKAAETTLETSLRYDQVQADAVRTLIQKLDDADTELAL